MDNIFNGRYENKFTALVKNCSPRIKANTPYISYFGGSGLRVICNQGNCKDVFENVAYYRIYLMNHVLNIISKYQKKFSDFQCWQCKILSSKCHRCSFCKSRQYCSEQCQHKDWKTHQTFCSELKETGTQIKVDAKERREQGDSRAQRAFESCISRCKCGMEDCLMVHQLKLLYGKLNVDDEVEKDEVD